MVTPSQTTVRIESSRQHEQRCCPAGPQSMVPYTEAVPGHSPPLGDPIAVFLFFFFSFFNGHM